MHQRCCKAISPELQGETTAGAAKSRQRSYNLVLTVCGASCCKWNFDATIVQQGHTLYCKKADTAAPSRCHWCYKRPTPLLQKGRRRCSELTLTVLQRPMSMVQMADTAAPSCRHLCHKSPMPVLPFAIDGASTGRHRLCPTIQSHNIIAMYSRAY